MGDSAATAVTRLLHEWKAGDREALDRLQTTAVVNEAYVKLFGQREVDWQDRGHFSALAAQLMRRILVDHARRELRDKRGGGNTRITIDESIASAVAPVDAVDALDLDRALHKLEQLDPDEAKIVELRFFGGLTIEETASALGISIATVKREWVIAKGWLYQELTGAR